MFALSPTREHTGRILPSSRGRLSNSSHDNDTVICFPAELMDRIIDHLHNDRPTLLRLGLTCRQTLMRSRLLLYSELKFTKYGDRHFDMFLNLLEASTWTSFTNAVESLHLKSLFYPEAHWNLPNRDFSRILAHLPNLKTLCLTAIDWRAIPSHIRDFFLQINITHLQLDTVDFRSTSNRYGNGHVVELFVALKVQPSLKTITLYNLHFHHGSCPVISQHSTFQYPIRLKLIDTTSLLLFKDVWDPLHANDLDITVESLDVRLGDMSKGQKDAYNPFVARFLRQIGPSLQRVFIRLTSPRFGFPDGVEALDLSQCINVRIVQFGIFQLDHFSRSGEQASSIMIMSTIWKSLSSLPPCSPMLEQVVFIVQTEEYGVTADSKAPMLESFAWLDVIGQLQEMFPNFKKFTVSLCLTRYADEVDFGQYLAALRRAPGIRQLEEKGTVLLQMNPSRTYL